MSTQKVDLANKLMQFAELSLDQSLKGQSNTGSQGKNSKQATGAKAKRDSK